VKKDLTDQQPPPAGLWVRPEQGLTRDQFRQLASLVYSLSGIHLAEGKESLVMARIGKRLRHLKLSSFQEYLDFVDRDQTRDELIRLIDVITTNVTSFFREPGPIEVMHREMLNWAKAGKRRFRLWSAACSTGEEPYSLAMAIAEDEFLNPLDWKILATDISTRALERAASGCYSLEQMAKIPAHLRIKYFSPYEQGRESGFQVKPILQNRVVFRPINLSAPPFPMTGPLEVVFCRNVMIYFDDIVRKRLIEEIWKLLSPNGLLCVGASESLSAMFLHKRCFAPSVYRKEHD
jgi:chemotaxis protein methyltransferase CheR